MWESGIEQTLEMLEQAGATIDQKRSRIIFPGSLVLEQIDRVPESLALFSRDGKNDLDLKGHLVYLGTGGAAIKILACDEKPYIPEEIDQAIRDKFDILL